MRSRKRRYKDSRKKKGRLRGERRVARDNLDHVTTLIIKSIERRNNESISSKQLIELVQENSIKNRGKELRLKEINQALQLLLKEGIIRRTKGRRYVYNTDNRKLITGTISVTQRGYGFISPDKGKSDFFVSAGNLRSARHGDYVEAVKRGGGQYGRERARVVRVIRRNDAPVTGRFISRNGHGGVVVPTDPQFPGPVYIGAKDCGKARENDRVEVEIIESSWYEGELRGRVKNVFGKADDPVAFYKSLIVQHKFREEFTKGELDEADSYSEKISAAEMSRREDLRDKLIITIDPESAHDFDDAISLEPLPDGLFKLGVHIADVCWYVRPGTTLDRAAYERGTSVYTSHGTLPMLPERLSSDLCSLREGVDRRTVSVFMVMKATGEVVEQRISRSVIRSRKRFTYEEVQRELDQTRNNLRGKNHSKLYDMELFLLQLSELTAKIRELRFRIGGVNLEIPEFEVSVDDNYKASKIQKRIVLESNHIVEECMLAANRCVTEHFTRKGKSGSRKFIYRVHDVPDPEKIEEYGLFVKSLGVEWPFGKRMDQLPSGALSSWLDRIKDHPLIDVIRIHALRAMAKAEYSTENVGHYGLGFKLYTHFTSPIRRYPDLIVHRLLLDELEGSTKHTSGSGQKLQMVAKHSSERERAAQEMERESLKARQVEYFSKHVGEEFEGMITSAIPKGVIVEITDTGTSGLILSDDLSYSASFHRRSNIFIDSITGEIWQPGDRLRVKVKKASPETNRIDLEIA